MFSLYSIKLRYKCSQVKWCNRYHCRINPKPINSLIMWRRGQATRWIKLAPLNCIGVHQHATQVMDSGGAPYSINIFIQLISNHTQHRNDKTVQHHSSHEFEGIAYTWHIISFDFIHKHTDAPLTAGGRFFQSWWVSFSGLGAVINIILWLVLSKRSPFQSDHFVSQLMLICCTMYHRNSRWSDTLT